MQLPIKAHSHKTLGKYLAEQYFSEAPKRYIRAFLIGCTEPDKNPTTYIKGSLGNQLFRGHNWESSQRYMQRISNRLEQRRKLRLMDFYTLGKLIHYTTDAFTSTHNRSFTQNLHSHRNYEVNLQEFFLSYLAQPQEFSLTQRSTVMDTIRRSHWEYSLIPADVYTDSMFSVAVSRTVISLLLTGKAFKFSIPGL